MSAKPIFLVSPGAVDGYPPVQYQARILAEAGHPVTLVTTPLKPGQTVAAFAHPGVTVRCISTHGCRPLRMLRFAMGLWAARRTLPSDAIEIAYDPIGLFYSDMVPGRPRRRVAHLHELLQCIDQFLERRLKHSIHRYDAVVVADESRAPLTQAALGMEKTPLVLENYPLRATNRPIKHSSERFEVVYCGSIGLHQRLDAVIRSIPSCPPNVHLVLIGDDTRPTGRHLKALAAELGVSERVHFLGWMDTPDAEQRIAQGNLAIALLDHTFEQWRTALGASNKRFQYMKAGLPQIGDTNPGVPELLQGIGACVDADTHDPRDIAALVTAYASDLARCVEEGERAFARHQEIYNYEQVFPRLKDKIMTW